MKILNVREGFACNSSSTHSIVFTTKRARDSRDANGNFGWSHFTAASEEAKRLWMAITIRENLHSADRELAELICKDVTGLSIPPGGDVDHQSLLNLPRTWNGDGIDLQFARDFMAYLLQPNAVIYGGNDNEETPPPGPKGERVYYRQALPVDDTTRDWVARKDGSGYWTLFNRETGNRVRAAFDKKGSIVVEAERASAPELVDLKITDFCTYDCPACYQGSTREGKHAGKHDVRNVLDRLARLRVFEVAIGGGEPTLHPDFGDILRYARKVGVVPNFTTRDPKWFLRHMDSIADVGGVAVSCDSAGDVRNVLKALDRLPGEDSKRLREKTTIQHILGIADEYETENFLRVCKDEKLRVILLGYKTSHRGATSKPKVPRVGTWGGFIKRMIDDSTAYHLGVDTVLAVELKGLVPDWRLTVQEGQFSCYIDAVADEMLASSFGTSDAIPLGDKNSIAEAWQRISAYTPESAYRYKWSLA